MKAFFKQFHWAHLLYRRYRKLRSLFRKKRPPFQFERIQWSSQSDATEVSRSKILNILNYTKTSSSSYSAKKFPAGYHTIKIGKDEYAGQRQPESRIQKTGINFTNKSVLDIGSNQGGMLLAVQEQIKWGVGVDYDYRMINASSLIKREKGITNLDFYVFDIDKDPHNLLLDYMREDTVDVVFLLAVCAWVKEWRGLINFCTTRARTLVFEANGLPKEQADQIACIEEVFGDVNLCTESSDDDPEYKNRQLLIAENRNRLR